MDNQIVDLCSGVGGFSLGAELAGFRTAVSIDIDPILHSSFHLNFPLARVEHGDIGVLDRDYWRQKHALGRPAGVIGGPPCQGFSRIGKGDPDDPRNELIGHFFRNVALVNPKFFVMENVEGLLDEKNKRVLNAALAGLPSKYIVLAPMVVNAADYGAATVRKRVIIVGYDPTEVDALAIGDFAPAKGLGDVTVADAISDLPSPSGGGNYSDDYGWAKYETDGRKVSKYAKAARRRPNNGLGWELAIHRLSNKRVSGFKDTLHTDAVVRRFYETPPGASEKVSRYPRLDWKGKCPTLRAGTGKDRGAFQAMRPIHPSEPRVITVREAARLQGFPDWFVFHPSKWHSFRMIGNSVSPHVSRAILGAIRRKC